MRGLVLSLIQYCIINNEKLNRDFAKKLSRTIKNCQFIPNQLVVPRVGISVEFYR